MKTTTKFNEPMFSCLPGRTGLPILRLWAALLTSASVWMGAFAQAVTIPVTSTADSGSGTLRDALVGAANGDTIDATGVSGTIILTSGELLIDKDVSILGPGPGVLSVNGNATSRVFHVMPGNTVTISNLTVTNGRISGNYPAGIGGGIYNDHATLTVSNCAVSDNFAVTAGGIFNDAADGNATLTILSSTVSGNSAAAAGGVVNYGIRGSATLEINASTISDNSATAYVGGIYNNGAGDGGGGSGSASLTIVNSTVSGNSAGTDCGGILNEGNYSGHGTLVMHGCTVSGNSAGGVAGGIWNKGEFSGNATLEIGNTILNASASENILNSFATVISDGYNLSSDDGGGFLTATGDQINTDPLLGPLQDNGGPTFTHALLPGSPAIDQGTNFNAVAVDQRGLSRTFDNAAIANAIGGDGTDIGSVEAQAISNQPPTAVPGAGAPIHVGNSVNLNGGASFDDNTGSASLQYNWSFFAVPAGNTATLADANTATPSFVPNVVGDYVVQLVVTDNGAPALSSAPAFVTFSSFNQAPTAVATATPALPLVGHVVSLDGAASSDPEHDSLAFSWAVTSRPAGSVAAIINPTQAVASFTPDLPGAYEVSLVVSDFLGAGTPASVSIVATTAAAFAEGQTAAASAIVAALPSGSVTNAGNQNALGGFFTNAMKQLQKGNVAQAIAQLNQAIERTDGYPLRGSLDASGPGRDWITNSGTQLTVYDLLNAALGALQP